MILIRIFYYIPWDFPLNTDCFSGLSLIYSVFSLKLFVEHISVVKCSQLWFGLSHMHHITWMNLWCAKYINCATGFIHFISFSNQSDSCIEWKKVRLAFVLWMNINLGDWTSDRSRCAFIESTLTSNTNESFNIEIVIIIVIMVMYMTHIRSLIYTNTQSAHGYDRIFHNNNSIR